MDWQGARDELRPKLVDVQTMSEAREILGELMSKMEVSHFGVIPREAYNELGTEDEPGARSGESGIEVRIVDDQVVVVSVQADSPAAKAGIQPGWI